MAGCGDIMLAIYGWAMVKASLKNISQWSPLVPKYSTTEMWSSVKYLDSARSCHVAQAPSSPKHLRMYCTALAYADILKPT